MEPLSPVTEPRRAGVGRPVFATFLSFLWPGLGQAYAGRLLIAAVFALPILFLLGVGAAIALDDPQAMALRLFSPGVALALVALIIAAGLWRLAAMVHANGAAGGRHAFTGLPLVTLLLLGAVVIAVHAGGAALAWSFHDAAERIFVAVGEEEPEGPRGSPAPGTTAGPGTSADPSPDPSAGPGTTPDPSAAPLPSDELPPETPFAEPPPSVVPEEPQADPDRINVLIAGLDSAPGRSHELTDTLIVVSVDRSTGQVAMVSFPRDIASFPMFDGRIYRGKINSLLTYARQHEGEFPDPPMRTLARELGYLLGIRVDHYAAVNIEGFRRLIDTVGGVRVYNEQRIADPTYPFYLDEGWHTLDGDTALKYVRTRKGSGDSDFTRAARQQQVLLALRSRLLDPAMLPRIPEILDALADTISTNYPPDRVAEAIDLGRSIDDGNIRQHVLGPPYSWHPPTSQTGGIWELRLDMDRVAQLSIELFGDDSRYAQATGSP